MLLDAPVVADGSAGCVWIHSDLQLAEPKLAHEVLAAAVDDVLDLKLDLGGVWCLGDALCGKNEEALDEVAAINIAQYERLAAPVCYVMGNHEMDLRRNAIRRYPLYELASQHPQWHTMPALDDFYFARRFFGTLVVFMGDHAARDGGPWWTTHGLLQDLPGIPAYPHQPHVYEALREAMANEPGPVVTASHYAYPGGQRPSAMLRQLLPLPESVRLHVYGHAHIGDLVHNKHRPYQRENPIDGQSLLQYNISALETRRSAGSHSAILEFENGAPARLRIRCHLERRWTESFELPRVTTGSEAR